MRGEFVLSSGEVELVVVHVSAALQPLSRCVLIGNEPIQTGAQKRLKAGLSRVVTGKMVFLERVGEKPLGQIFCVLVACLPFQANVFVDWFPITFENGVESTLPDRPIVTECVHDSGVVRDRNLVKRTADVSIWIHKL